MLSRREDVREKNILNRLAKMNRTGLSLRPVADHQRMNQMQDEPNLKYEPLTKLI